MIYALQESELADYFLVGLSVLAALWYFGFLVGMRRTRAR